MAHVLLAGHPPRLARVRGDETVEALPKVADCQWACRRRAANRKVEIDQRPAWVFQRDRGLPSASWMPGQKRGRVIAWNRRQACALAQCKSNGMSLLQQTIRRACCSDDEPPRRVEVGIHAVAGRL